MSFASLAVCMAADDAEGAEPDNVARKQVIPVRRCCFSFGAAATKRQSVVPPFAIGCRIFIEKGSTTKGISQMFGKALKEVIDPSRAALAAAIAQRDAAQRKVDAATAAAERASALVEAAEGRCEAAVAALATRRKEGAQRLLEMATTGGAEMPNLSVREASQADLDAAEGLLAAKDALATCVAHLKGPETDLRHAEWHVEQAVAPVLAAEVERALVAAERLADELNGARAILSFLRPSMEPGSHLLHRIMTALPATPPGERAPDLRSHPALAPWRAAREALMRDADAALPK